MQGWEQMREQMEALLLRASGEGVPAWNARIATQDPPDEAALRAWLDAQGVHGYAQSLLVMERFGYPDFLLADASALVDAQYADRAALRPLLEEVLARAAAWPEVVVQARKTYVCLLTPRRTFAQLRPATRTRLDLGLRLPGTPVQGRLLAAGSALGNSTHRLALAGPEDLDEEAWGWLERAREVNA